MQLHMSFLAVSLAFLTLTVRDFALLPSWKVSVTKNEPFFRCFALYQVNPLSCEMAGNCFRAEFRLIKL